MKQILAGISCLLSVCGWSQQVEDLVLYGLEQRTGTPRFQGMAGAFGALGADFSALAINPAGAAVFNHNQLGFSLSYYSTENLSQFNGSRTQSQKGHLGFNQAGVVFVYQSKNSSPWKRLSLALNSDNSQQYRGITKANGFTSNGVDEYFLDYASGTPFGDILKLDNELLEEAYLNIGADIGFAAQQAFLGYYGGVLDPSELNNNAISSYVSNAYYSQVSQQIQLDNRGKNSKFIATAAAQYQDFLFLGAGIEFQSLSFQRQSNLTEGSYDADSPLSYLFFDNFLETTGEAAALSVGGIAKLGHSLRLGLSYKSPTWYTLLEKTHQQLETNLEDVDLQFIDKNIINVFEEYQMTIPSVVTASAAIVIGKRGLISADYSSQDFSKARFRPAADAFFGQLNTAANSQLETVNNLRIGGEFNLGRLALRAGYNSSNSPFKNNNTKNIQKTFGMGFIFGSGKLDLAYSRLQQNGSFRALDYPTAPSIGLDRDRNTLTLGYTLFL